jgi:hypothetical protein
LLWLLDDAAQREAEITVELDARAEKRGACSPFHPGRSLRAHIERRHESGALPPVRAALFGRAFHLTHVPHPSCVREEERSLVGFLGRPRTLIEIADARLGPPQAVDRLLAFLWAVGGLALELPPDPTSPVTPSAERSPLEVLGLGPEATLKEVRAAYRRLARELHPDLHPGAAGDERARLEARFRALHEAYRRLVG